MLDVQAYSEKALHKKEEVPSGRGYMGTNTQKDPVLNFLHTRKTFSHWLTLSNIKKWLNSTQYLRETKSISFCKALQLRAYIRLVQSVHFQTKVGNGCILGFHCGLMSQCFGTWYLWKWVSILHVSCHRGKMVQINSNTTSPYWDMNLWAFPPLLKNKRMNDRNSGPTNFFFFPSLFFCLIPSLPCVS